MEYIYASLTASISELKKNPTALLDKSHGEPIALLNHNKLQAYLVPAQLYKQMLDVLEDQHLLKLSQERLKDKSKAIKIDLDKL